MQITGGSHAGKNSVIAKSSETNVTETKTSVFDLIERQCTSEFNSIYIPGEGDDWKPNDENRKIFCEKDKIWKNRIVMFDEEYKFAADGSWVRNWGSG